MVSRINALSASLGAFSTWLYYVSIHKIGATRAMGLDITYGVWAEIIQRILHPHNAGLKLLASSIIITLG
ncbi:hypothetical protein [Enterovibrio norvegicus]|uniref:hypothetical protein n=1 Tax=Enterovibrio norvegicus TaxID=188144 RepID=UPI000303A5B5|nr:hypothetical protein [Enterovibrio norvegicus]